MIEPLRFHTEKAPSFVVSQPAYCGLCISQKKYRDDPNLAVFYCPECPRRFQCERCDIEAHSEELSKKHIRRLLVIGPGVRKKVLRRGDARNFPAPLDWVQIRVKSRTYLGGKMIGREAPMPLYFQTGLSGPSVHVQVLGCRGIPAADMGGTSDPVVVALFNGRNLGETRARQRTLNPNWDNETFVVPVSDNLKEPRDMAPREKDLFKLELYDYDTFGGNDFLGHVEIHRPELIELAKKSKLQPIHLPFTSREFHGRCFFSYGVKERIEEKGWMDRMAQGEEEEKAEEDKVWDFVLRIDRGESLDKLNAVGYSDPLCEVYFGDKLIGVTPHKEDTCNPKWDRDNEFRIPIEEFIAKEDELIRLRRQMDMEGANVGDADAIFRVELFDYNYWLPNRSLGTVHIPVRSIRHKAPVVGLPYGEETHPPPPKKKRRRVRKKEFRKKEYDSDGELIPSAADADGDDGGSKRGKGKRNNEDEDEDEDEEATKEYDSDDDDSSLWASDDSRFETDTEGEDDDDTMDSTEDGTEKGSTADASAAGDGPSTGSGADKEDDELALMEEGGIRRRSKPDIDTRSQNSAGSGGSDKSNKNGNGGPPRPQGLPPSRPAGPPPKAGKAASADAKVDAVVKKKKKDDKEEDKDGDEDDSDDGSYYDEEEQSFIMKYICCCFASIAERQKKVVDHTKWAPQVFFNVEKENKSAVDVENDERGTVMVRLIPSQRGNVVMGLDEGVRCMSLGETATLKVRFDHAYNSYLMGANCPPRSNIVFTVELQKINGDGFLGIPWRQSLRFYRMSKRVSKRVFMTTTFCCRKTMRLLGLGGDDDDDSEESEEEESLLEDFEDEWESESEYESSSDESEFDEEAAARAEEEEQKRLEKERKKNMPKGIPIEHAARVGANFLFSLRPMPKPKPRKKAKRTAEEKARKAKEKEEKKLIREQMMETAVGEVGEEGKAGDTEAGTKVRRRRTVIKAGESGEGEGQGEGGTDGAAPAPDSVRRRRTTVRKKPPEALPEGADEGANKAN